MRRTASSILLAVVVLLVVTAVAGMALGRWRFAAVDSGSMRPALDIGDVALLSSERTAELRRGQIVAFHPPGQRRLTVIHRVIVVERTQGGVVIRTRGDANDVADAWRAHILGDVVWREQLKVPLLGYLASWSQLLMVRLAVLIALVALLVRAGMGWIWRPRERPLRGARRRAPASDRAVS
jgi:signal peptidase I